MGDLRGGPGEMGSVLVGRGPGAGVSCGGRGVDGTDQAYAPRHVVSGLILLAPELGAEHLPQRVSGQEDRVHGEFLGVAVNNTAPVYLPPLLPTTRPADRQFRRATPGATLRTLLWPEVVTATHERIMAHDGEPPKLKT